MQTREDPRREPWPYPLVIGWNEYVALPKWGITGLRAKTDTGARTSALHAENIEPVGLRRVRFDVILSRTESERRVHVEAPVTRTGRVRSSTGHSQLRYFVRAVLRIGPAEREIEMSLVDREHMSYRMLLGRSALSGLLIDPRRAGLQGSPKQPARRKRAKRR